VAARGGVLARLMRGWWAQDRWRSGEQLAGAAAYPRREKLESLRHLSADGGDVHGRGRDGLAVQEDAQCVLALEGEGRGGGGG
jgi:hypothetical protein